MGEKEKERRRKGGMKEENEVRFFFSFTPTISHNPQRRIKDLREEGCSEREETNFLCAKLC